jgi:hypothetical protein
MNSTFYEFINIIHLMQRITLRCLLQGIHTWEQGKATDQPPSGPAFGVRKNSLSY